MDFIHFTFSGFLAIFKISSEHAQLQTLQSVPKLGTKDFFCPDEEEWFLDFKAGLPRVARADSKYERSRSGDFVGGFAEILGGVVVIMQDRASKMDTR